MLRVKLPGRDLDGEDQVQFIEEEIMSREDYDIIIDHGYQDWFMDYWRRVRDGVPGGLRWPQSADNSRIHEAGIAYPQERQTP